MKKIKMLYITRKYPPAVGGMENFSYHLYRNFDSDKMETDIISLGKSQWNLLWFLPYATIKTLCKAKKYDIIFVGDALLSAVGFFTKIFYPKKIVVVNVFGLDITFQNSIYQFYLKLFYQRFDKYISISRETDNTLHKKGDYNSIVITPGVDINQFHEKCADFDTLRKKYNIQKDDTILVTVGRLVKRKGVNWFVQNVMPKLKAEKVKYLIVGTGEDKETIEKNIIDNHLQDLVIMLGRVPDDMLNAIYTNADVFVMPNIHVEGDMEGFGLVAIEANLAGLSVVASGIEGIKDAIINGKNGQLLESENASQFYEKIKDIIQNRDTYHEEAAHHKQYTIAHYSWKSICKQYETLFENLIASQQQGIQHQKESET